MALIQKRKKVRSYADLLSEKMLDRIISLVEKGNEKIVAYTAQGEPINKETAIKVLHRRSSEMKKGKLITHEEVKKRFNKKRA